MIYEIIAGVGIGLWGALAVTVLAFMYAKKHDLIEQKKDRFLRGDIDTAQERIEELEREINHLQNAHTELSLLVTKRLGEIYAAVDRATREDSRLVDKEA